jgi:hypothetical protein
MQMRTQASEKHTPRDHRGQEGNKTRSALRILNVLRYALIIAFAMDEIVLRVVLFVQRFLCFHVCESAETHALSGEASLIHASTIYGTTASIALPTIAALGVILHRKHASPLSPQTTTAFPSRGRRNSSGLQPKTVGRDQQDTRRHAPAGARARMHT